MLTTPQLLDIARDIDVIRNRLQVAIGLPRYVTMPSAERDQITALAAAGARLADATLRLHRAADAAAPVVDMVML